MFFMQNDRRSIIVLLLHTLVSVSIVMVSISNGFLLFITLETFSLLLYVLTLSRKTYGGIAAGVKYFVFGTLGSIIIFWGLVNVYASIRSVDFAQIDWFTNQLFKYNYIENTQSSFAVSTIGIGFLIKFGVVPSHL
jgi:NADH:ubiquinone oxidoreductase subunit 2 (subunit N)